LVGTLRQVEPPNTAKGLSASTWEPVSSYFWLICRLSPRASVYCSGVFAGPPDVVPPTTATFGRRVMWVLFSRATKVSSGVPEGPAGPALTAM
jgi:hypothetical protein